MKRPARGRRRLVPRPVTIALLLLLAASVSACTNPFARGGFHGTVLEPPNAAPDFVLTDQNGSAFRLSDQRGQVLLLFFGYTTCPDICPTAMADFNKVRKLLGDDAGRVRFTFVSVDPERDTVPVVKSYVEFFHSSFVGLTGERPALEAVWKDYGVAVVREEAPQSGAGYLVSHSSLIYAIDGQGRWRLLFPLELPAESVAEDVRALLREQ